MTNSRLYAALVFLELLDSMSRTRTRTRTEDSTGVRTPYAAAYAYRRAYAPRTALTEKQSADDINLNRSKSSQQARKIEEQLAKDLEALFQTIMKDESKDFAVLQRKYGPKSEQLIRTAVQQIYLIGSAYATSTQNTTAFITQKDLENIRKQVDVTYASFWRRVYDALHKEDIIIPTEEPSKPVDPAVEAALISTVTATTTLALSTLSKLSQLPSEEKRTLVWVTEQDPKVCEICRPLQGREWDETDFDIPQPGPESEGGATHHRCRCRLLIKQDGDILLG